MNGAESRPRTPAWLWGAAFLVLGVCGGLIIATSVMKLPERGLQAPQETPPPAAQAVAPRTPPPAPAGVQRQMMAEASFEKDVMRMLELEHSRNLAAIDSARRRLDDKFRGYAERVPQFASELNSISLKYHVVKALVQDKLESSHEMRQVAGDLFAKRVLSDSQLHADMEDVVAQFHRDLDTNRGLISSALGQAVALESVSDPTAASSLELLARERREELNNFVEAQAERVPTAALEAIGQGVIAEESVRRRVTEVIASHVAGSAPRSETGSGAEEGTAKSPQATPKGAAVAGAAVGVLAGAADYWLLQSRFEAALASDCRGALDKMRDALWADPRNGLEAQFTGVVELVNVQHGMALRKALPFGAP